MAVDDFSIHLERYYNSFTRHAAVAGVGDKPADTPDLQTKQQALREAAYLDQLRRELTSSAAAIRSVRLSNDFFGIVNPYVKAFSQDTFGCCLKIIEHFIPGHIPNPDSSPGGRYYRLIKHIMQNVVENLSDGQRADMERDVTHNPCVQEVMRGPEMAYLLEEMGQALPGEGVLFGEQYNNKFLVENSNGKIVSITADDLVRFMQDPSVHVILTSSHAQAETVEHDVLPIMQGIEALARESHKDKTPLNLAHLDTDKARTGQTLIVYACDTRRNPFLNAAALLRRLEELREVERTGNADSFREASPGAKRLAKLMLKCMVEDSSRIDVNDPHPMAEIATDADAPITLRADAVEVAHRFQLIGYSKGGNVVSDAMRYLVCELTAKRANGQDVFAKHPDSQHRAGEDCAMSQENVRNIVRSIATLAIASIEVGMSEHYIDHGVRRDAFNNKEDAISWHQYYEGGRYDQRWLIQGNQVEHGHSPVEMLGNRERRGYAYDDTQVARRGAEFFAPNYGKAAISHVHFDVTNGADPAAGKVVFEADNGKNPAVGKVLFEAATGTTDAQIQAFEHHIREQCAVAGLYNSSITSDPKTPGIFTLICSAPNGLANDAAYDFTKPSSLEKLQKVFTNLRDKTAGLLISQSIDEDIGKQYAQAANDAGSHLQRAARLATRGQGGGGIAA